MLNQEDIDALLLRYLLRECEEGEKQVVERWLAESSKNRKQFEDLQRFHELVKRSIQERAVQSDYADFRKRLVQWQGRRRRLRILTGVAAGIALVICLGYAFFFIGGQSNSHSDQLATNRLLPGKAHAILHLSDGRAVNLNTDARHIEEQNGAQLLADGHGRLDYQATDKTEGKKVYNRLEVPRGGEFQLALADGTKVWLNAESELRYPATFTGKERRVALKGEAYFQVATDSTMPFIVQVGEMETRVYGTEFNISTQEKGRIETVLVSGRIGIRYNSKEMMLAPSQKAAINLGDKKVSIEQVNILPYIAWKDGIFMFQNESLEDIMEQLGRWYDIDVFFSNEGLKSIRLSGMLERDKDARELFRHFEKISSARFSVQGRTVVVNEKK